METAAEVAAGAGQAAGGGGEGRPNTGGQGAGVESGRPVSADGGEGGREKTDQDDEDRSQEDAGESIQEPEVNGALSDPEPEVGEVDDRPGLLLPPPPPPGSATKKQLTTLPEEEPQPETEETSQGVADGEGDAPDDEPTPPTPRARSSTSAGPRSPHPAPRTPRSRRGRSGVGWEPEAETADDRVVSNGINGNRNNGNDDAVTASEPQTAPPPEEAGSKGAGPETKGGVAWVVGEEEEEEPAVSMGVKQGAGVEMEPPPADTLHHHHPLAQEADSGVGSAGEEPDLTPRPDDVTSPRLLVGAVPHGGRGSAATDSSSSAKVKAFSGKSTLSTRASTLSSTGVPGDSEEDIDSINVAVRVRPASKQELQRKDNQAVEFPGNGSVSVDAGSQNKSFTFNVTFEPQASQEDVFDNCGVKKLVEMALDGYSCTAFAFGQTGSGKTHTITGPPELFTEGSKPEPELYGLIPRSFHFLFRTMNKRFGTTGIGYRLFASYMEIYNEQVIDLLNPNQRRPLAVRWSKNKGFYVENLFVLECETMDDIMAVLEEGLRNRATGSNSVNEHSSRSHSMLTLHIDSEVQDSEDENVFITKHGKLTFVDLAGSEKVKTELQNTAGHLAESNNINKSLLVLGNCISALGDAKRRQGHIPYRDSKLTKLLADSLGGNGVTLMIACISPSAVNAAETLNTLRYANRAKKIKTKPAVKMDPREKLIMSLKREIKILRQENHYLRKQLEFPVKPKGQLQKENDERFLQMLRDHQESGGTGITDHGLYEMLQEYMIENETLRTENSDLHQLRDTSRREQQVLARENEKLLRKLETLERERMLMQTPLSIYSVGSTASRQTSASELQFERTPHNTPPAWGHNPPPIEYYGRDSTQGSGSWVGNGGGSKAMPHENGPVPSYNGPARSRNPPAHLQHPMRPPHRLSEPVVNKNSPGYEVLPPGLPPGSGYPVESARTYVVTPGQGAGNMVPPGPGMGMVDREYSVQSDFNHYMAGFTDGQRNHGYMSRYYQQQDYYRDNPPGNPPPKGQPQGHPQGQPQGYPQGHPQGYPQGHPAGRGQGWAQPQSDYSSPGGPPGQYGPQSQGPPNYNNNYGPGQPPYGQGAPPPQQAPPVESPRGRQPAPAQRNYNSYNQDHPVPTPRKSKGPSPGSQGSKSNYSRTGPAKKPAQKAAPPPPEPKESIEDMNERLKRELMDLEGAIKQESHYKGVKTNGYGGRR